MKRKKRCSFSTMYFKKVRSQEFGVRSKKHSSCSQLRTPNSELGFTFIEILMTLTVIALLFVPIMQLFSNSLYSTNDNLEMITAMNLAQSEMERVINLNYTKAQLAKLGTQIIPAEDKPPLELNKALWRVKRETIEDSDPLEVHVSVYKEGEPDKVMVQLVTLIEDLMWEQVKQVSAA